MKYIFYLTGKSSSGKDSIYGKLLGDRRLDLTPLLLSTTRPRREGEEEGREYHFSNESEYRSLSEKGEVIECRTYETVHGPWRYFTVKQSVDGGADHYLGIGTLESYMQIREYFGRDRVIPIYIEVDDGDRLIRAINREKASGSPDYREMCRRFLADDEDFSEEKLERAGIGESHRFVNDDLSECIEKIGSMIIGYQGK